MFPEGAVLVFGGTGGIGRAVALEFARAGSDVAIVYRSKADVANETAEAIRGLGRRASVHQADIASPADVKTAIDAATRDHARLHTIILGAGPVVPQVPIAEVSADQWREAIEVELQGCFNVVQASLPLLRSWGGGSYVHLGSAGHLRWPEKDGLSVIPKAANEALIKGLAREEGRHGVRANSVLVGVIEAGMFLELSRQGAFDAAWVEETHKMLALKRWGQPEEIGHAAVFLASEKAAYITGQQINVSGGFGL